MSKSTLDEVFEKYCAEEVEKAGAQYVGIQECEGRLYDLVLFNSPLSGSTLCVKSNVNDLGTAVAKRLADHEVERKPKNNG
jgi:hypothetical protein